MIFHGRFSSFHHFFNHTPGHTQDPPKDSTGISGVTPEVPDPPSYRVESVSLATLYQSLLYRDAPILSVSVSVSVVSVLFHGIGIGIGVWEKMA